MRIQNYKKRLQTMYCKLLDFASERKKGNENLIVFLALLTIISYNEQTGAQKL